MKTKHIIDTDASPKLPARATLIEHRGAGKIEWKPKDFDLYLSEEQKDGWICGNDLRKKLRDEPVMNVNVAQYLVDHPELYPNEWKGNAVFFWGTIVRHSDGLLRVPYLVEDDGGVVLRWYWPGNGWYSGDPALRFGKSSVLKSSEPIPLETLAPLGLESAIKTVKEAGYKIIKEY